MTPFIAEIIGTFLLILLGCGVNANVALSKTYGSNSGWIVITTGWALAVYTGVVVAGPYSGAHLNPAVTIGLAFAGEFSIYDIPHYIAAQFIGAMFAAFMVWLMHKDHFDATVDKGAKLAVFCNTPAIPNVLTNVLTEILGTFVLVFAVLFFTDATMAKDGTIIGLGSLGALPVALIVWGIGLSLGGTTGYAINPARDLGPRIIHALVPIKNKGSNGWGYAWIPVVAPVIGAVLAAILSNILQ
ncbi:Major intrinsic protein [Croceitalea dokdonensis DOKDO 023]|uniref:Major intrinsic protein n=1 Tax=Croceitalea dokdonensis DOKDO 023 TaxID=1300341 RepID=A0A0P7AX70_9FLAO|nr:MIP/aquaporin family protein [Croceitalea dokdonensis]KPM32742.1 Major intrinsic protein [Croceitalea dokdonensis DOKDO 023]